MLFPNNMLQFETQGCSDGARTNGPWRWLTRYDSKGSKVVNNTDKSLIACIRMDAALTRCIMVSRLT